MRFVSRSSLLLASLLVACGASAAEPIASPAASGGEVTGNAGVGGERYEVRFARRHQPGQAWALSVVAEDTQTRVITVPGQPPQQDVETTRSELSGIYRVVEVDAQGSVRRASFDPQRLVVDRGQGAAVVGLPAHLVLEYAGDGVIRAADGTPLSDETQETLDDLLHVGSSASQRWDDSVLAPDGPQPVGAEWSIDAARAAEQLGDIGVSIRPGGIGGRMRLIGVEEVGGASCLALRAELVARDIGLDRAPEGSRVERSELRARMEGMLPRDASLPTLDQRMRFEMVISLAVDTPLGTGTVSVSARHDSHEQRTMLR